MPYDYSNVPPPRDAELIPHGTVASVQMRLRPGGAGEGGLLKRSKDGACEMIDAEFVIVDGPHAKRKLWENLVIAGTTDGHAKAAEISRGKLRAILESARGIKPEDMSPQARTARTADLKDFDNMIFIARVGVERGKPRNDGGGDNYPDKNILAAIITPDKKDWHPIEQPPPFNGGGGRSEASSAAPTADNAGPVVKPVWAS